MPTTAAPRPVVHDAESADRVVTVTFDDGTRARFHPVWLREHCGCAACRHPQTLERILDPLAVPLDLDAVVRVDRSRLVCDFTDGHTSTFDGKWLAAHAVDLGYDGLGLPPRRPWASGATDTPRHRWQAVVDDDRALTAWLTDLWTHGATLVEDIPDDPDAGVRLARRVSPLRPTNFGETWDVVARDDPNNVAFTAIELDTHNDLPYFEYAPGVQFLHCLRFDATGGESVLVDGLAAAHALRDTDPEAWELLTTVPVAYRFVDGSDDLRWTTPVIVLDHAGEVHEVRHHLALAAPPALPVERLDAFYRAWRTFAALLREPDRRWHHRLRPGEMIAWMNRRVLHGRRAFDSGGERRLRGCYVDVDEVLSRLRVLTRSA